MSSFNQEINNESAQVELIKESLISFHSKEAGFQLYPKAQEDSEDLHFGVFEVEMAQTPMCQKEQEINSTNDMSGSMQDICNDGRSKMQHLHLTLENILRLLSTNAEQSAVNLEITGFDDLILQVLDPTKITSDFEQLQQIINAMKKSLYPRGSTNIHLALQDATTRLQQKQTESQKSFIFMTDGNITTGTTNIKTLKQSVPKNSQNYFIGFGADHDFALLQELATINSGSYYYVDKIENAGLVFGEIIHSILYTALRNVTINVTNGEIYDFQTNQWLTEIRVSNLCGEAKKTFHVRSQNPNEFQLTLTGTGEEGEYKYEETVLPPLQDVETGVVIPTDLTKFMYRQKVLELLYQTTILAKNLYSTEEDKTKHQNVLRDFRKQIEAYSASLDAKESGDQISDEEKDYLKQLTDDLYISEKTLHSEKALLYSTVRQNAQGHETSYNVTQIDRSSLRRQRAFNGQQDEDDNYNVTVNPISRAYTSDTQAEIMRSCSATGPQDYETPQEQDQDQDQVQDENQDEYARISRSRTIQRSNCHYSDDDYRQIQRS